MSWSLSIHPQPSPAETTSAIEHAEPSSPLTGGSLEQLQAAKVAAISLVESGAVGDRPVVITLSGHANADHRPAKGWANDVISLTIAQVSEPTS